MLVRKAEDAAAAALSEKASHDAANQALEDVQARGLWGGLRRGWWGGWVAGLGLRGSRVGSRATLDPFRHEGVAVKAGCAQVDYVRTGTELGTINHAYDTSVESATRDGRAAAGEPVPNSIRFRLGSKTLIANGTSSGALARRDFLRPEFITTLSDAGVMSRVLVC